MSKDQIAFVYAPGVMVLAAGNDPQLARAIKEVTERAANAPKPPTRPEYEKRIPRASGSGRE